MAFNILLIELILACHKEQNIPLRLLKQRHFHDQWQLVSSAECLIQKHLYQFTFSVAYSSGAANVLGRRKWEVHKQPKWMLKETVYMYMKR
jgi:outer membrane biogenesis lipoprotein LolB